MEYKKTRYAFVVLGILWTSFFFSENARADAKIILSKMTMEVGEQIEMTIISSDFNGTLGDQELLPIRQAFEIDGQSKMTNVQIVNGKQSVLNTWIFLLTAIKEGTFKIPPLKIGNSLTKALSISIQPNKSSVTNSNQTTNFLLLGTIDNNNPYVQSEVIYSFKLLYLTQIFSGEISRLNIPNIPVKTIAHKKQYKFPYKGKEYNVLEWRYAFIPRNSGEFTIPRLTFRGNVGTPQGKRRIRLTTEPIKLMVKPQSSQWRTNSGFEWLPAKEISIWEKWQPSVNVWIVNQRYSREIKLVAKGVESNQIANLTVHSNLKNISVYPQNPTRKNTLNENGHLAQYNHKIDYVPQKHGIVKLPAIKIPWWDTQNDELKYATLPSRTLRILPDTVNLNTPTTHLITNLAAHGDPINTPTEQSTNHQILQTLAEQPQETVKFGISFANTWVWLTLFIVYSLLLILMGMLIAKLRYKPSEKKFISSSEDAFKQHINQLTSIVKTKNPQRILKIYQLMLRCYNKYRHEFTSEINQQWLEQIHNLRHETTSNKEHNFDFSSLLKLLKSTIQQSRKTVSDLPNLYRN